MTVPDVNKQLRKMAVVCVLLGPILAIVALTSYGGVMLFDYIRQQPHFHDDVGLLPLHYLLFGFAERSLYWMIGLGAAFFVTGLIALRGARRGRLALLGAGWIGIAGMVALTGVWSYEVYRLDMHWLWHVLGAVLHGIQVFAMWRGIVFLGAAETVAATDG